MGDAGLRIVTDLKFWRTSPHWQSNVDALLDRNAVFVEGVNVYTAWHDLSRSQCAVNVQSMDTSIPVTPQNIGLVVFAGFYPHRHAATALQALTAQFPKVDALVLYASRFQRSRQTPMSTFVK